MQSLVRQPAPAFTAKAIMGNDVINEDFSLDLYPDRFVLLFFYQLDFTFVCPSEILAFDEALGDFLDFRRQHRLDDHLCNLHARFHRERCRAVIDQDHADLAAVARVDCAG